MPASCRKAPSSEVRGATAGPARVKVDRIEHPGAEQGVALREDRGHGPGVDRMLPGDGRYGGHAVGPGPDGREVRVAAPPGECAHLEKICVAPQLEVDGVR